MIKRNISTRGTTALLALLLAAPLLAAPLLAAPPARIAPLTYLDRQYMTQQRTVLEDLSRRNLGRQFTGQKKNDLPLLQQMLDRELVGPGQTRELQAMGVVMGDLLAVDLGMDWVVYEDRAGRSRALRYQDSDSFLFPITMISRRREAGNTTSVREIYDKAFDIIDQVRTPLPFH